MSRADGVVVGALILAASALRVLTLRTIDMGGDATFKWFFVRSWTAENAWIYDHHTARFAVNLPTWLVQQLFGSHPNCMYIAPVLASIAQIPLLYDIGRKLSCRPAGIIAALLLFLFEPYVVASSQLLPGIFQATYVLAALHASVSFALTERRRWLVASAAWLFLGYLAMMATVYVIPGFLLAAWLVRRRFSDAGLILMVLTILVGFETLAYAALSDFRGGQFQIVAATHTNVPPTTLWGMLRRVTDLPVELLAPLALWLGSALLFLRPSVRPAHYTLWLVPASGVFGMCFGIKSLRPLVPATFMLPRYFDAFMPPIALCLGFALVYLGRRLLSNRLLAHLPSTVAVAAVVLTAWLGIALYKPAGELALIVNHRQWQLLNRAYSLGIPIVGTNRSDHAQKKTLRCIQWGYLRDDLILENGQLVRRALGKAHVGRRVHLFVSRHELDSKAVVSAIKAGQCYLGVARSETEPRLRIDVHGGPACHDLGSS